MLKEKRKLTEKLRNQHLKPKGHEDRSKKITEKGACEASRMPRQRDWRKVTAQAEDIH